MTPVNKSILITGCSTGIGRCLAFGLHRSGFNVIATCRKEQDCTYFHQNGLFSTVLDLDSSDSIHQALETTLEYTQGELYGLINNGAYGQPGAVEDLDRKTLRDQFETNVLGTQELTNRVIPIMRKQQSGRIVQISSVLGFICLPYRGAYNASKYALEALSDTLRLELAGSGIQVSLIEPGPIESAFRTNSHEKFLENIDPGQSDHEEHYQILVERLRSDEPTRFTLPARSVLKVVQHALNSPNPKIRYRVTTPTKVFAVLKRLLPDRIMDRMLSRIP